MERTTKSAKMFGNQTLDPEDPNIEGELEEEDDDDAVSETAVSFWSLYRSVINVVRESGPYGVVE